MTMAFWSPARKHPNKAFFVPNGSMFLYLHGTSHIEKFEGSDFENDNILFFKFQPKIPKLEIFFENSKVFSF